MCQLFSSVSDLRRKRTNSERHVDCFNHYHLLSRANIYFSAPKATGAFKNSPHGAPNHVTVILNEVTNFRRFLGLAPYNNNFSKYLPKQGIKVRNTRFLSCQGSHKFRFSHMKMGLDTILLSQQYL